MSMTQNELQAAIEGARTGQPANDKPGPANDKPEGEETAIVLLRAILSEQQKTNQLLEMLIETGEADLSDTDMSEVEAMLRRRAG